MAQEEIAGWALRRRRRSDSRRLRRLEQLARSGARSKAQLMARPRRREPRGRLGPRERLHVRVGDRDHVAAAVAVEPDRPDRLTDLEVGVRLDDAVGREHRLEAADLRRPARSAAVRALPSGTGSRAAARSAVARSRPGPARRAPSAAPPRRGRPRRHGGRDPPSGRRGSVRPPRPPRRPVRLRRSAAGTRCRRAARAPAPPGRQRARRARADRHRPTPDRRGSSRRRSRCRAGAAGRTGSASSASPPRAITMPFISMPSTNASTIASLLPTPPARRAGAHRDRPSESSGRPRAGRPSRRASGRPARRQCSTAARPSASVRTAAKRGCGTPASARVRRIPILCVIRCAVSVPIVGSPSRSVTAATTGTARSARPSGRRRRGGARRPL